MSRTLLIAAMLAGITVATSAGSAFAQMQSAYERGLQIAAGRGYPPRQGDCFARLFARRATLSPSRVWVATVDGPFTDELWQRCRIQR